MSWQESILSQDSWLILPAVICADRKLTKSSKKRCTLIFLMFYVTHTSNPMSEQKFEKKLSFDFTTKNLFARYLVEPASGDMLR